MLWVVRENQQIVRIDTAVVLAETLNQPRRYPRQCRRVRRRRRVEPRCTVRWKVRIYKDGQWIVRVRSYRVIYQPCKPEIR